MTYELVLTGKFKKSLKLARKRGLDISKLEEVVEKLLHNIPLDVKHRDHELKGAYTGFRECHIQPDWLLIYLNLFPIFKNNRRNISSAFISTALQYGGKIC